MMRIRSAAVAAMLLTLMVPAAALERVEAVNFAKQDFVFPDDIQGEGTHLLFLGVAIDQDNGTWQGEELIRWHRALESANALPDDVSAWHFAVMEGLPFFVKGIVRRAIGKTYEGLIPPDRGAVLYIKDIEAFAASAAIPLDGQPTILAYTVGDGIVASWRGEVSDESIAGIGELLRTSGSERPDQSAEISVTDPSLISAE